MVGNYPVITLCGSTRFKDAFMEAQKRLTLEGYIVISVGLFGHSGDSEVWENMPENTVTRTKAMLDDMHKRKIDMADEIYVINVDDYIGESTRSEIAYAREHGKIVRYLEPHVETGSVVMGLQDGPSSVFLAGKANGEPTDYSEEEAFLRQMLQGGMTAQAYTPDEATARLIAYQVGEDESGCEAEAVEPSFADAERAAQRYGDDLYDAGRASAARSAAQWDETYGRDGHAYAVDVSETGEELDPVAAKETYALQMLEDGYDISNTAYFIGEDEAFVRAVMLRNGITDADLIRFQQQ